MTWPELGGSVIRPDQSWVNSVIWPDQSWVALSFDLTRVELTLSFYLTRAEWALSFDLTRAVWALSIHLIRAEWLCYLAWPELSELCYLTWPELSGSVIWPGQSWVSSASCPDQSWVALSFDTVPGVVFFLFFFLQRLKDEHITLIVLHLIISTLPWFITWVDLILKVTTASLFALLTLCLFLRDLLLYWVATSVQLHLLVL